MMTDVIPQHGFIKKKRKKGFIKRIKPDAVPTKQPPNTRSRQEHAMLISAGWRKSLESILEAGSALIEARDDIDHGEFEAMIKEDLPFTPSTARRLMIIATNPVLSNRAHAHVLPPAWTSLYELSKLNTDTLTALIEDGTINPKMERREAEALSGQRIIVKSSDQSNGHDKPEREPMPCAFCADTRGVRDGSKVTLSDQEDSRQLADQLAKQIEDLLSVGYPVRGKGKKLKVRRSPLRQKIDRIIDLGNRVHPEIRGMVADALRTLIRDATELANELSQPVIEHDTREADDGEGEDDD
jgi:hypothetical protein